MHFVLVPVASAGLMMDSAMEVAALPGPFRLTREEVPQAILDICVGVDSRSLGESLGWIYR